VTEGPRYGHLVLRLDHVIVAVPDLERAAAALVEDLGLATVPGGVHPGFGTANRIGPLGGGSYIELMAVHDPAVAATTDVGRWVTEATAAGSSGLAGWMLAPDDLEATATRLGIQVVPGERRRPDGTSIRWRLAGLGTMVGAPPLPAFIAWDVGPDDHPSATPAPTLAEPAGVEWVEVAGADGRLAGWLGTEERGVEIREVDGPPGLRAVGVATADGGELVLQ